MKLGEFSLLDADMVTCKARHLALLCIIFLSYRILCLSWLPTTLPYYLHPSVRIFRQHLPSSLTPSPTISTQTLLTTMPLWGQSYSPLYRKYRDCYFCREVRILASSSLRRVAMRSQDFFGSQERVYFLKTYLQARLTCSKSTDAKVFNSGRHGPARFLQFLANTQRLT